MIGNSRRRATLAITLALWATMIVEHPCLAGPDGSGLVLPASRTVDVVGREGGRSGSWWLGSTGVVLALALLGAGGWMARRTRAVGEGGDVPMRVVGRTSLSPRHAVVLLRVGDRTLMIGTGPQGPPTLLGEWAGPVTADGPGEAR